MNTLRWILSLRGHFTTLSGSIEDAPMPGTIGPSAADKAREQPTSQDRLARIAMLLTADTDARLIPHSDDHVRCDLTPALPRHSSPPGGAGTGCG